MIRAHGLLAPTYRPPRAPTRTPRATPLRQPRARWSRSRPSMCRCRRRLCAASAPPARPSPWCEQHKQAHPPPSGAPSTPRSHTDRVSVCPPDQQGLGLAGRLPRALGRPARLLRRVLQLHLPRRVRRPPRPAPLPPRPADPLLPLAAAACCSSPRLLASVPERSPPPTLHACCGRSESEKIEDGGFGINGTQRQCCQVSEGDIKPGARRPRPRLSPAAALSRRSSLSLARAAL